MSYRDEVIAQAKELGLEFPSNIPTEKLSGMVTAAGGELPVNTDAPEVQIGKPLTMREIIAKARKDAFKTRVVTITNKDAREADDATAAFLSCQNEYFELAKVVPLNVAVELEQCLIDVALCTNITLHKSEIKNGKPTGNKIPVPVKKYTISYAQE